MDAYLAWFLLLAPLAAAVAILLHLHRSPNGAIFASVGSASVCFLIAIAAALGNIHAPPAFEWMSFPATRSTAPVQIEIGMIFDALSKGMLLVVTGVGLLVHIYSIGYMAHDPARGRFFGGLSIFMFSMTGIVLSTNLIEMFFFWEGVGLSSYLLIGFWYEKASAAAAANKAFICNRLADIGFMVGILTYWILLGSLSVRPDDLSISGNSGHTLIAHPGGVTSTSPALLFVMVLGLFMGCVGKSAMVPFHVWLPDAMEGPTPVSALIHAATMVAAGVYMLCRIFPLLMLSEAGMDVIAFTGCFTALFAALIAIQQNDIKRILAYSTLSQLGYMVMAVGSGGPDAAMFHLTTHAFFKALLFLAAGSVIHALHEEQDIWKMGGLGRKIPLTFACFAIGMLALIGLPPFAGFFSKDYLLSVVYEAHPVFYWTGVFTAGLTAFYMTRLIIVAFFGKARTPAAEHPHRVPWVMTIPLLLLAVLSLIGGWSSEGYGLLDYFHAWKISVLHPSNVGDFAHLPHPDFVLETLLPGLAVLLGVGAAWDIYAGKATDPLRLKVLARKFYIDEFYDRFLVYNQQRFAGILNWIDGWVLDGFILRGSAYLSVGVGELLRLFQTGSLQTYAFLFSLGTAGLIWFTLYAR